MLEFISLQVINEIFTNAKKTPSPLGQLIYIRALMDHFKNAPRRHTSLHSFVVPLQKIKSFEKYHEAFKNLETCELIKIEATVVKFYNLWSKYIDLNYVKSKLSENESKMYFDMLQKSLPIKNECMRLHGLSEDQYKKLVSAFVHEQTIVRKRYHDAGDCFSHFTRSLRIQLNERNKSEEKVVSVSTAKNLAK